MLDWAWSAWLGEAWGDLTRHGHLPVPAGLAHPSDAGFSRPWFSEPVGQVADWTASLDDGSRVHVHEYPDGSLVVHRDALDPARGPLRALGHVACETTLGRWLLLGALGVGIAAGLSRLGFGFTRIPLSRMVGP